MNQKELLKDLKIANKKVVLGSTETFLSTLLELEYKEPPHASQEK
ncbi:MAG: hypothetical protein U1F57_02680 [bacterium]